MAVDAKDIAKYIISYFSNIPTNEMEGGLTNLKLQKLLYYVQVMHLKKYKSPAFNNKIEAWNYGPVVVDVYREYKHNGKNVLDIDNPTFNLPANMQDVVDGVIEEKGMYTGYSLMRQTHREKPWKNAYNSDDKVIKGEDMMEL